MNIFGFVDIPVYVIALVVLLVTAYIYYTWNFNVWKERGIPHPRPVPVFGTIYTVFKHGFANVDEHTIKQYGKVHGLFEGRVPALVVADLEMLKDITVKEFGNFVNRRINPLRSTPFNQNVGDARDDQWKLIRSYMTPTFSGSKMRHMSPLIVRAADQFVERLQEHCDEKKDIGVKEVAANYTMEVIASTGFGIVLNTQKDENHPFVFYAKRAFGFTFFNVCFLTIFFFPFMIPVLEFLGVTIDDITSARFFIKVVADAIEERKTGKATQKDFLKLMLDAEEEFLQNKGSSDSESNGSLGNHKIEYTKRRGLTTDEVTAQAMVVIIGGYDTISTTLSYAMYNLACHPEIQERVVTEIQEIIRENEQPNYDNIIKLHYLDQVIDETLRIFPPAIRTERVAAADIEIKGYKIPKDTIVILPIKALHMNPEVWPEPQKFDPDRFTPANKAARHPYNYMPFGAGPRKCMGFRLAQMKLKMVLVKALRKFKFVRTANTEFPLKMSKQAFVPKPEKPAMIGIEHREEEDNIQLWTA